MNSAHNGKLVTIVKARAFGICPISLECMRLLGNGHISSNGWVELEGFFTDNGWNQSFGDEWPSR